MGDKGSAIVISVKPGVSTTDARIKGFTEEMKANHPDIKLLPVLYDNDLPATAASQIQSTLAAHPDLGGVFAGNTNTAQGISTGLQAAGKQGKVKVAAFDAEPDEVTALKNGTLDVLVAQDPAGIGTKGVDQALAAIDKKKVTALDRHRHGRHHQGQHERRLGQQVLLQGRLLSPASRPACHHRCASDLPSTDADVPTEHCTMHRAGAGQPTPAGRPVRERRR